MLKHLSKFESLKAGATIGALGCLLVVTGCHAEASVTPLPRGEGGSASVQPHPPNEVSSSGSSMASGGSQQPLGPSAQAFVAAGTAMNSGKYRMTFSLGDSSLSTRASQSSSHQLRPGVVAAGESQP